MKYKIFLCPIFNHFIQPSPPPLPDENLYMVSSGVNSPIKNGPNPLWLAPHMMTLKSFPNLYVPLSPINMTTMIRQYTEFSPSASSPR